MLVQGPLVTHHVDDLLQRDAEGEHEGLRLVDDRPLEVVVAAHQVAQQLLLVVAAYRLCKGRPREAHFKVDLLDGDFIRRNPPS